MADSETNRPDDGCEERVAPAGLPALRQLTFSSRVLCRARFGAVFGGASTLLWLGALFIADRHPHQTGLTPLVLIGASLFAAGAGGLILALIGALGGGPIGTFRLPVAGAATGALGLVVSNTLGFLLVFERLGLRKEILDEFGFILFCGIAGALSALFNWALGRVVVMPEATWLAVGALGSLLLTCLIAPAGIELGFFLIWAVAGALAGAAASWIGE